MAGNSFGTKFRLTTFGESHGEAIGGIIDGCPSNIVLDQAFIQAELNRRKPGQSKLVTQRKEADEVVFLSGIFEGKTLGTPIAFQIQNNNSKAADYDLLKDAFRPSHADYVYQQKYKHRDYRGGGRSSARETTARVVGGAIAKQLINPIEITAYVSSVGTISVNKKYTDLQLDLAESNDVRCPDPVIAQQMEQLILDTKKKGDTVGGIVTCVIKNVPIGLGEPVFDRLEANLAKAMLSINACKGFSFGSGFEGTKMFGSEHNDYYNEDESTKTNFSGGIQGGISNGMDIYFDVAFKPVATLLQPQEMLTTKGTLEIIKGKGRHDACVVPRAVVIVEAMAALVLADFMI
ncbi:chorismate synthase [Paenimyroides aestuarii]|uniref:Chorismate synthase n=1 Tax=Paenimyroides aestuarii TaxID=2968490 RepID=A0ABY5NQL6_9FLAO|nr:chorismate synthase [Paenimyroides aestuarii]UUV20856.1 chorismate synthase [Paenimyroides aestuarii]